MDLIIRTMEETKKEKRSDKELLAMLDVYQRLYDTSVRDFEVTGDRSMMIIFCDKLEDISDQISIPRTTVDRSPKPKDLLKRKL